VSAVGVGTYRERVAAALAAGWRFGGLHASAGGGAVRTLLVAPDGSTRLEETTAVDGAVASIVDLAPAANWDEREAHDLYGIRFAGHEPLRPLIDHDLRLERWTVPVRGHDPYQIAVGPIHAGVIESGHFRFHVVGDRILYLDARLFYKHRGLEQAAVGKTLDEGLAYVSRSCAACAVANGVAYAHACEQALGLAATPELARARTILLELERTWSHLNDVAAVCAGVGLAAGNNRVAGLTERARRLNARLTGHRFLFGSVRVGASDLRLSALDVREAREELEALRGEAASAWRELVFNASFQDRLPDVGVVDGDAAERLGAVGPAARAAGLAEDVRAVSPRLAYDGFGAVVPERAVGDVQARLEQRALELWQSFALLDELLDGPVDPSGAEPGDEERATGIGRVESPRGATSCVVERAGERIERLRLRTGSYANWPVVAYAAADNLLPDFPLINKSFELCYACADR
jgi:Ni,Fe-hydrogenase III large subunit